MTIEAAYRLAWMIELSNARERARNRRQFWKHAAYENFDPLAATCLAELIYTEANR